MASKPNLRRPSGAIFYDGPSLLDRSQQIIGILTFKSGNIKTGNLIQSWILNKNLHPVEALHQGKTNAICGNCPLQGDHGEGRGCYVTLGHAPSGIHGGLSREIYPLFRPGMLSHHRGFRFGAYGDPTAIPLSAWKPILKTLSPVVNRPGYTHQWMQPRFKHWSKYLMASTHSLEQNKAAHSRGWRTFRTITSINDLAPNEILCPASPEAGNKATCETCGACNGRRSMDDKRKNIAIVAHGAGKESTRRISLKVLR